VQKGQKLTYNYSNKRTCWVNQDKTLIIEEKMAKKAKNISHEEISEAMARFLKKGGVIEKIEYNDNGFLLKNDLALDDSYTETSDSIMSQLHIDFETEKRI